LREEMRLKDSELAKLKIKLEEDSKAYFTNFAG
jgi:hypothetical protein